MACVDQGDSYLFKVANGNVSHSNISDVTLLQPEPVAMVSGDASQADSYSTQSGESNYTFKSTQSTIFSLDTSAPDLNLSKGTLLV